MKQYIIVLFLLLSFLPQSCGTQRYQPTREVETQQRTKLVTRTELVTVNPTFDIPEIREMHRAVPDSVDVIDNEWACSSVRVWSDGTFDHNLEVKSQSIEKQVQVPVTTTDVSTETTTNEKVTQTVQVNILHWWQKALMYAGAVSMVALIVKTIIFIIKKTII